MYSDYNSLCNPLISSSPFSLSAFCSADYSSAKERLMLQCAYNIAANTQDSNQQPIVLLLPKPIQPSDSSDPPHECRRSSLQVDDELNHITPLFGGKHVSLDVMKKIMIK